MNRIQTRELSYKRIFNGITSRIANIPHTIAWNFSSTSIDNKKRIESFKDIHIGKRCFIVANGPSIQKMDLSLLKDEFSFGLNRIYLAYPATTWRPTYYLAVNELVIRQFYSEIENLEGPKFLNWNCRKYFQPAQNDIVFFKPKLVLNDYFEAELTKPFVFGGTVTFVALQLAYYMGFQEVILIGLDHKYTEKGTPNEKETRSYSKDTSHFHPDYFPKGIKWQLPDLNRSEIDYSFARDVYQRSGRKIIDATLNGGCQIFEKKDFLKLFIKKDAVDD